MPTTIERGTEAFSPAAFERPGPSRVLHGGTIVVTLPSAIPIGREIPCVPTASERGAGCARLGHEDLVGSPFEEPARCAGSLLTPPRPTPTLGVIPLSGETVTCPPQPACARGAASSTLMIVSTRGRPAGRGPARRLPDSRATRRHRRRRGETAPAPRRGRSIGVERSCSSVQRPRRRSSSGARRRR